MPEKLTANSDGTYKVTGPHGVHAKNSTKANAEAQMRLLNAIDHGFKPKGAQKDSPTQNVQDALKGRAVAIEESPKHEKSESKTKEKSEDIKIAHSRKVMGLMKKHDCAGAY